MGFTQISMANLFQLIRSSMIFVISQLSIAVCSFSCLMKVFAGLLFLLLSCNDSRKITSLAKLLLIIVQFWPIERSLISSWSSWYTRCSSMQITSMPYSSVDATSSFWFSSELDGESVDWRYKSVPIDPYNFCLCLELDQWNIFLLRPDLWLKNALLADPRHEQCVMKY